MRKLVLQYVCLSLFACLLLLLPAPAGAQAVTGVLSGTVTDPSGAVVPAAPVTIVHDETGNRREMQTAEDGSFVFNGVFPGRYTIRVEVTGFKSIERRNVNVTAYERVALGRLALEVGASSESVTVTAEGQSVQTQSMERGTVLNQEQVSGLMTTSRRFMDMLKVLPGASYSDGIPNINGLPSGNTTMIADGSPTVELGSSGQASTRAHIDSIGEVKVLTSNYQAEFGGAGGAMVQVVTKAGTTEFHGSGWWYRQHESFNANSFFQNKNKQPRARVRQNQFGWSLGGPIYWPEKFNTNKDKLFFFVTQEYTKTSPEASLRYYTVPTNLEIAGDFSQSLELDRTPRKIKDPLNGGAAFPDGIIPKSRINPNGQKLLTVFPDPTIMDWGITKGQYNWAFVEPGQNSRDQYVARVDYNPTDRLRLYIRALRELNKEWRMNYYLLDPLPDSFNRIPKEDASLNGTYMISPTMVNEFQFAFHHHLQYRSIEDRDLENFTKSKLGITLPEWYGNNRRNLIPSMIFDAPNSLNVEWNGIHPWTSSDRVFNLSDAVSKIWGSHSAKAGISVMQAYRQNPPMGFRTATDPVTGRFDFSRDINNANDANYGYANVLLGNYRSYTEPTSVPITQAKSVTVEWYLQDNWKATSRLTLDYGMRFSYHVPYNQGDGRISNFSRSAWQLANAPALYRPVTGPGGVRMAQDPFTNDLLPAILIGAIVPGSGSSANGMILATDAGIPKGFMKNQGVLLGPRFGLSWDVFGDGKTAIRTGGAISYQVSQIAADQTVFVANPPIQYSPITYYGNMANLQQSAGVMFPSTARGWDMAGEISTVYNYSFGIQRNIGFSTVLDVAYVGNQARHLPMSTPLNTLPYGARFLPESQDPTKPGKPLPDTFLAPYRGYSSVTAYSRDGSSNYNSLQVQANRRFASSIQFGVAYTYSSAMGYLNFPTYNDRHFWSYGRQSYDRAHSLIANWVWTVPNGSKLWSNFLTKAVLDGWEFSGIASFLTGTPLNLTFTTVDGADLTGGGDGQRMDVIGNPHLSKGERGIDKWFDPTVFARPAKGTLGTLGRGLLSGPGINNFDTALTKAFTMREKLKFSLRFETFNTFNHTQFSTVNTAARFDSKGKQVNDQFGQITNSRAGRTAQGSLRVTF